MMADLARSENCLHNRKLMRLFGHRYTTLVIDALIRGDSEIMLAAARSCKSLSIALSRRLILTVFELFSLVFIGRLSDMGAPVAEPEKTNGDSR
jgi:hypothetical protein